jgi:hypothetical protein
MVGAWRCILAFDSVADVKPPPTPPPVLSPFRYTFTQVTSPRKNSLADFDSALKASVLFSSYPTRNPGLVCAASLYNDLQKVFQFQNFEKVPDLIQCDSEEKLTSSDAKGKTSDEVDDSGSDSDEDPQSGEGDHISSILFFGNL